MAHTFGWLGEGLAHFLKGDIDAVNDTLKASAHLAADTIDTDNDDYHDDATNEIAGTGYTAGGVTLANVAITHDDTNDRVEMDFDNPSWGPGATLTDVDHLRLYKDRGGAASADEMFGHLTFDAAQSVSNATFTVEIDAEGALAINDSA
jgi:hypothetical protein